MSFIKFVLLICFVAPCILAVQAESKINWEPVWSDIEGNNEFVYKRQDTGSDEASQTCDAPNGLGLKNLFHQVGKILPKEQIKRIVKSYDEDSEVRALRAFMRKPETQEKLREIRNSAEYQILKDYTCRVLHIDLLQYNKLARSHLNPSVTRAGTEERTGIRGLINAIDEVLPYQQIHDLYRNLLASDEELVKAVENLKSEEFRQLLLNVRNNVPAYKELTKELRALGVPLDEMRELAAKALGWPAAEENLFV